MKVKLLPKIFPFYSVIFVLHGHLFAITPSPNLWSNGNITIDSQPLIDFSGQKK